MLDSWGYLIFFFCFRFKTTHAYPYSKYSLLAARTYTLSLWLTTEKRLKKTYNNRAKLKTPTKCNEKLFQFDVVSGSKNALLYSLSLFLSLLVLRSNHWYSLFLVFFSFLFFDFKLIVADAAHFFVFSCEALDQPKNGLGERTKKVSHAFANIIYVRWSFASRHH